MDVLTLDAKAKVNLTLDITGLRADGYHLLRSIMHEIALCDTVRVGAEPSETAEIRLAMGNSPVPSDGKNTMHKAAAAFMRAWGRPLRVEISAQKRIPVGAGLGGGSSDAAAVLKALNRLTNAGFSREKLCEIGLEVGADVPFCVAGGTAVVTGIGEGIAPLPVLPAMPVVICKPEGGVSTPVIYSEFDRIGPCGCRPDNALAEAAASRGDIFELCRHCKNVLTPATSLHRPEIVEIRSALAEAGALAAEMSGSGSAVFGIFESGQKANAAAEKLRRSVHTVILTSL